MSVSSPNTLYRELRCCRGVVAGSLPLSPKRHRRFVPCWPGQARPGQARYVASARLRSPISFWSGPRIVEPWVNYYRERAISVEGMRFTGRFDEIEIRSRDFSKEREREEKGRKGRWVSRCRFRAADTRLSFAFPFVRRSLDFALSFHEFARRVGGTRLRRGCSLDPVYLGRRGNKRRNKRWIERVKLLARTGIYTAA